MKRNLLLFLPLFLFFTTALIAQDSNEFTPKGTPQATSTKTFKAPQLANHISELKTFSVYPETIQASESLYVELDSDQALNVGIAVYSLSRSLLLQKGIQIMKSLQILELPVNQLAAGTYIIEVKSDKGKETKRFTVR